ncbi:MAG: hypothetical protein HOV68_12640, partial [Streptomycetaceae bacterium]|nr:hypothetical protein [Streptomycetaceae bacterium]
DLARQRRVVDAFLAAARDGDFEGLCAWLAPDASFHLDLGQATHPAAAVSGAEAVARQMLQGAKSFLPYSRPVLVNGAPGRLVGDPRQPRGVAGFTVAGDRVVRVDVIANPDKLKDIALDEFDGPDEFSGPDADGADPFGDSELREHLRAHHGLGDPAPEPPVPHTPDHHD